MDATMIKDWASRREGPGTPGAQGEEHDEAGEDVKPGHVLTEIVKSLREHQGALESIVDHVEDPDKIRGMLDKLKEIADEAEEFAKEHADEEEAEADDVEEEAGDESGAEETAA